MLYVIAYDIPCNRRRRKVAELLEGYGQRVQYSVFECVLSDKKLKELKQRLRKRINLHEDSLRFYAIPNYSFGQIDIWNGLPFLEPQTSIIL
jgi:CRISPR-associated protein Cas2